jgi:hypothetical protein
LKGEERIIWYLLEIDPFISIGAPGNPGTGIRAHATLVGRVFRRKLSSENKNRPDAVSPGRRRFK